MYEEFFDKNPYIISDTHFFHEKIGGYCKRPKNWQELIIENWNKTVSENDYVLHLGDFALGSKELLYLLKGELNGKIVLLKGNHDRNCPQFYNEIGLEFTTEKVLTYKNLIFSHRPIDTKFYGYNVHGHTHNIKINSKRYINVCVENLNYTPIKLSEIFVKISGKN